MQKNISCRRNSASGWLATAILAAVSAALPAFLPFSTLADDSTGTIVKTITSGETDAILGYLPAGGGDVINIIKNADGTFDVAHIFTNTTSGAEFTVSDTTLIKLDSGRILVVGGGGAGGGDCGGGGGGGGVVYEQGLTLASGANAVEVGGGAQESEKSGVGGSGKNTVFTLNGTTYTALGGGGGGSWSSDGSKRPTSGGSGGGGGGNVSQEPAAATQPSSVSGGYGNSGGTANYDCGGGGGGAAGVGGDSVSAPANKSGDGGAGFGTDITGVTVYYGAGGGGGGVGISGAGGSGVGGNGSQGNNSGPRGNPGKAGTGSGGGGGPGGGSNNNRYGGAGGSGIVVIRYTLEAAEISNLYDGSILYTFKTSKLFDLLDDAQTFRLPEPALVRVLAVGGGGAGASGATGPGSRGGNGGGGAGGFVDITNVLAGATYNITIGAGGVTDSGTGPDASSRNGGDTVIATGGTAVITAFGGGGGGAYGPGAAGGSGGGGSCLSASPYSTGEGGAASQGNVGGVGTIAIGRSGAGGGGAGGPGANTSTNNAGADGGAAKGSDITGPIQYYAAGGGGGARTGTGGKGGAGEDDVVIGGTGGGDADTAKGKDGTGSGGGGGSNSNVGGAGGSGIVHIRVIRYMPVAPEAAYGIEFDGAEHRYFGLVAPDAASPEWKDSEADEGCPYTITLDSINGTPVGLQTNAVVATAVGVYRYTVALKAEYKAQGYVWADFSAADRTVVLTIGKKALTDVKLHVEGWQIGEDPFQPVLTANMTLADESSEGAMDGDYYLRYSSDGANWKVFSDWYSSAAPGKYYVKATIRTDSPNFEWTGENPVEEFKLWEYVIGKYPDYLGYHSDVNVSSTSAADGARLVLVRISEGVPFGFSYDKAQPDGSDIRFTYKDTTSGDIVLLPYEFEGGWNAAGETLAWVSVPAGVSEITMNWGVLEDTEIPESPDASGIWDGVQRFPALEYARAYHAEIVVTNAPGTTIADYPMALVLSNGSPNGFTFGSANADGSDLAFSLADGTLLAYEIETWNNNGKSLVWVKVPEYKDGATFYMHWGVKRDGNGNEIAVANPESSEVWSAYAGVWHMTGAKDSASGASTGTLGNKTTAVNGIFGGALSASEQGEPLILATASENVNSVASGSFTVSFYTKYNATSRGTAAQYLFSRRQALGYAGYALCINSPLTSTATQFIDCFGEAAGRFTLNDSTPMTRSGAGKWVRNDIVYTSNRFYWYVNGEELYWTRDMSSGFSNGTTGLLGIGGLAATGSDSNINGAIDEFRIYAGTPDATLIVADTNQWKLVESGTATFVSTASIVVSPDPSDVLSPTVTTPESKFVNRWVTLPSVAPLEWTLGYVPSTSRGSAAYGTATYVFKTLDGTELEAETLPDAAGTYTVTFTVPAGEFGTCKYGALAYTLPDAVTITAKNEGGGDLSGTSGSQTLSGRVLLANDDNIDGHEVSLQSYWQTNRNDDVFWVHEETVGTSLMPLLTAETVNTLIAHAPVEELCGATNIWYLYNVRLGNTYPKTLEEPLAQLFLPYSSSAKVLDQNGAGYINTTTATNSVNLIIRNVENAAIYSPCYTNGIGTIYFDAVNGWATTEATSLGYGLVVEVATNCTNSVGSEHIPTDSMMVTTEVDQIESFDSENKPIIIESVRTVVDYERANWQPLAMTALYYDGAKFNTKTVDSEGKILYLDATEGGGHDKFFRVIVPVNKLLGDYRGPARFRIKRVSFTGVGADNRNMILVDNIVVSYPAMTANLEPHGKFDSDKSGKMVLGNECAFDVPFPSVADTVTPRGKVSYETNPLDLAADTSKFVVSATMYYRWRYLNQMTGDWKSVAISPTTFNAISAMDFGEYAGMPGDVEFWYETRQLAPFYSYVDYSGMGLDFEGIYSEDIPVVTNRASGVTYESQGTDWFVRLREGKSDYEAIEVAIGPEDADALSVVEMEVTGPHSWRGFFPTPTNLTGNLKFQVRARNRQETGATEVEQNILYMRGKAEDKLPISVTMSECGEGEMSIFPIEVKTGYLMFMLDDSSHSLTVVRADYQNFNQWSDAKGTIFVGTSTDGDKKSGTSSSKLKISEQFTSGWTPMPATTNDWTVPYVGWTYVGNMLGRSPNTPFTSDTSGIWQVGPGMWVPKLYDDRRANMGVALQMQGQGYGYLQLTDSNMLPRGYGNLSFNARVAQDIAFNDFSYYDGGGYKKLANYTFTARVAFDFNSCNDFRGNAALSLVAYYQPNVGCYEYRIEPVEANSTTTPSGIQTKDRLRMSLYKWSVDTVTGGIKPKLLGSYTNNFTIATVAKNQERNTGAQNYIPMYISVSNDVNGVACIMAGVGRSGADYRSDLYNKPTTKGKHYHICYRDTKAPHASGSYGCLTTNSKGVFQRPTFYDKPIGFLSNFTTNDKIDCYSDNTATTEIYYPGNATSCKQSLTDKDWTTQYGRMTAYELSTDGDFWGVRATEETISQTLTVSIVPVDEVSSASKSENWPWTDVASVKVSGFGTSTSISSYSIPLYITKDSYMKIAVNGNLGDVRRDIVIDSLNVTSWRGASWNEEVNDLRDYTPYYPDEAVNVYTNFSYFSAWVTNAPSNKAKQALLLSAKRTAPGTVCGIKSPLMDGGSTSVRRGSGLGMISFRYENAQSNVRLKVQVATNDVGTANFTQLNTVDGDKWIDWQTIDFGGCTAAELKNGVRSVYIGLHGVKGAVRIIMDPAVVNAAATASDLKYGEIFITGITCTDEPSLDERSWWGWNLRAVGSGENTGADDEGRMYLPDMSVDPDRTGLSMALNNSITQDIDTDEAAAYSENMPFVQTPTFAADQLGEVMFRARRYGYADAATDARSAYVALYGARAGTDASAAWTRLEEFEITNKTFTTYSYKTDPGSDFAAFRLAVTGVEGVKAAGEPGGGITPPVRVLLDEVMVSEAVRPSLKFRNVGAFRGNKNTPANVAAARTNVMRDLLYVNDVPSEDEQPLCNEVWGVQCEVYAAMLPDEIDFDKTPRVRLHYFRGKTPWGYDRWKDKASARTCTLSLAENTNGFYRSSYVMGPESVLPLDTEPGIPYQYMLEVVYYQVGSDVPMTNWLSSADWEKPAWYNQIDYNSDPSLGNGEHFAAYNILDTVAPHWSWINEVNLFGRYDRSFINSEAERQYVEIAAPAEADLSGWQLRMLEANDGSETVITNTVATFGANGLSSTKTNLAGMENNMVFHVVGSGVSKAKLKCWDGSAYTMNQDGTWRFDFVTSTFGATGEILAIAPIGIQLVRASGIVEHEIVTIGTNWWGYSANYSAAYHPTNTVNYLNDRMHGAKFFYAGADEGDDGDALGVFDSRGEAANVWTNSYEMTPGRMNDGQYIDPNHPRPNGDTVIVYCNLDTSVGHLSQTIGGVTTNINQIFYLDKGSTSGLTIRYDTDRWFQLDTVKTGNVEVAYTTVPSGEGKDYYQTTVGLNATDSFTIIAKAKVIDKLVDFGLGDDNRYTDAVVDWLSSGRTRKGAFADTTGEDIKLADYYSLGGDFITNLTLTAMYWLDMDPTVGGLRLCGGMSSAPSEHIMEYEYADGYMIDAGGTSEVVYDYGTVALTNLRMNVKLWITNSVSGGEAWAPYMLRGVTPGTTSLDKGFSLRSWSQQTNVTFKITGLLANGLNKYTNKRSWVPLRWFVFAGTGTGAATVSTSFDANYESKIEIIDPYSEMSPGWTAWGSWFDQHGGRGSGNSNIYYYWSLDDNTKPIGFETLYKENYYE